MPIDVIYSEYSIKGSCTLSGIGIDIRGYLFTFEGLTKISGRNCKLVARGPNVLAACGQNVARQPFMMTPLSASKGTATQKFLCVLTIDIINWPFCQFRKA